MAPGNSPGTQAESAPGQDPGRRPQGWRRWLRLPGVSPSSGEVASVSEVVLPEVAVRPRHGKYSGQGQGDHGPTIPAEVAHRGPGGGAQPGAPRLGQLLRVQRARARGLDGGELDGLRARSP